MTLGGFYLFKQVSRGHRIMVLGGVGVGEWS